MTSAARAVVFRWLAAWWFRITGSGVTERPAPPRVAAWLEQTASGLDPALVVLFDAIEQRISAADNAELGALLARIEALRERALDETMARLRGFFNDGESGDGRPS